MKNEIKSKTRLVAIQLLAQHLINNEDIEVLKDQFDSNYRNTSLAEGLEKVQYNNNLLSKIIKLYKNMNFETIIFKINNLITFNRNFEKWDTINKAIILISLSEILSSDKKKIKIILNDYIEISKSFVTTKETKLINLVLDKLINEKV
tara:strand:+ start:786 stop:1229 length:444 start_codon:yes stop_codon:yes gene_type:complete